jgi:co-chaperonin GroES (HSP10)
MKAINYYIVVEKIKEPPKKVAGLELTEDQNKDMRYLKANVISTGNLVKGIKDGDLIYYDRHAGHGIQWKDATYHVINQGDVVIVDS